jgi:5-methylcytosine-specific restriction endonuclease McrBC regulatory subunit McrC
VADCKYKRIEAETLNNHDYYQVLAYCTATAAPRGLIIYPRQEGITEKAFRIRNTIIIIDVEQCSIDCGMPIETIEFECDRFAEYVWSRAMTAANSRTRMLSVTTLS